MKTEEHNNDSQKAASTAVNFYILSDSDLHNRLLFVYRLVEKAYDQQLSTLIVAADEEQLHKLDKLVWSVTPERFIPHEIMTPSMQSPIPSILLTLNVGDIHDIDFSPQVAIDLSHEATPLNYPKVMLIANQHNEVLANARMKYQSYVNSGIKPAVHKLSF